MWQFFSPFNFFFLQSHLSPSCVLMSASKKEDEARVAIFIASIVDTPAWSIRSAYPNTVVFIHSPFVCLFLSFQFHRFLERPKGIDTNQTRKKWQQNLSVRVFFLLNPPGLRVTNLTSCVDSALSPADSNSVFDQSRITYIRSPAKVILCSIPAIPWIWREKPIHCKELPRVSIKVSRLFIFFCNSQYAPFLPNSFSYPPQAIQYRFPVQKTQTTV